MSIFILSSFCVLLLTTFCLSRKKIISSDKIIQYVNLKCEQWKRLNLMVSTTYKSPITIKIMSVYMVFKFAYLQLMQCLTNSVTKIDKHHYEISYVINGRLHKMIIKPERGPSRIDKIVDHENNDITDVIMEYHGPKQKKLSPSFFNTQFIVVHSTNGEIITINDVEEIDL